MLLNVTTHLQNWRLISRLDGENKVREVPLNFLSMLMGFTVMQELNLYYPNCSSDNFSDKPCSVSGWILWMILIHLQFNHSQLLFRKIISLVLSKASTMKPFTHFYEAWESNGAVALQEKEVCGHKNSAYPSCPSIQTSSVWPSLRSISRIVLKWPGVL